MPAAKPNRKAAGRKRRLAETIAALTALQFGPKQRNETAAYTLLALLNLQADAAWADSQAPLCGITPVIDFIDNSIWRNAWRVLSKRQVVGESSVLTLQSSAGPSRVQRRETATTGGGGK